VTLTFGIRLAQSRDRHPRSIVVVGMESAMHQILEALGQMEERLTVTLEGRCGALEQRSITAMEHLRRGCVGLGDGACVSVVAVIDNFSFDLFKDPTTTTTSAVGALRYDNEELVFDAGPIFDEEHVFDGESSLSTRFDSPSPFDSYSFTLPQTPAELVDEPNHDEASPLSLVHDDWADLFLQTGSCPECSRCCLLLLNRGTDEGGNLQSQHSTTSQLLNSGYLFEKSAQPWEERDFGIPYATAPSAAVSSNDEVEAVVAREIHGEVTRAEATPQQPWRFHACVQRNRQIRDLCRCTTSGVAWSAAPSPTSSTRTSMPDP
jgi:hypothetical protein